MHVAWQRNGEFLPSRIEQCHTLAHRNQPNLRDRYTRPGNGRQDLVPTCWGRGEGNFVVVAGSRCAKDPRFCVGLEGDERW